MTFPYPSIFLSGLVGTLGLISTLSQQQSIASVLSCPIPALSRIQKHQVSSGESLESIAEQYKLNPATIIKMNPFIKNGKVRAGSQLQIPPFNGMVVEVPRGQTWRQVAKNYQVRADTLFEINGCQENPRVVFVPILPSKKEQPSRIIAVAPVETAPSTTLAGYPLANPTTIALRYGWRIHPITGKVFFHSGVDLLTPVGTPVQAIAPGIVVFAKDQASYGKLVIINHVGGMQTRYAQLETIEVTLGQTVQPGEILGTVGFTGEPTSKQPHLHFEVRASEPLGWVAKDPQKYFTK